MSEPRSRPPAAPEPPSGPSAASEPPSRPPAAPAGRQPWFAPTGRELTRSQRLDAEARARLKPLSPGERPRVILASAVIAALLGLATIVAYIAGAKIGGKRPAPTGIVIYSALMLVCAGGLWRLWYGAVLGFMALLAIIAIYFALLLIEASNVLAVVVAVVVIVVAGYLFFKLVRVLSRIQMPRPPGA